MKTTNPHVYNILLKFGGEEGRGRKRLDWGVMGWGVTLAAAGEEEPGETGKADMHQSPKQQPRSRERGHGRGEDRSVPEALQKRAKT